MDGWMVREFQREQTLRELNRSREASLPSARSRPAAPPSTAELALEWVVVGGSFLGIGLAPIAFFQFKETDFAIFLLGPAMWGALLWAVAVWCVVAGIAHVVATSAAFVLRATQWALTIATCGVLATNGSLYLGIGLITFASLAIAKEFIVRSSTWSDMMDKPASLMGTVAMLFEGVRQFGAGVREWRARYRDKRDGEKGS